MSLFKTGGRAFPTQMGNDDGMTLRDYFAAKAMQGMLSSTDPQTRDSVFQNIERAAVFAYEFADGMLQERDKEEAA